MKQVAYISQFSLLAALLSVVVGLFLFPLEAAAQGGAGGFVPCDGINCSFCHLIDLGSSVLNWLFGIVFVLFGVMVFVSGFNLVTSGGNKSKLDGAKKSLSNALIGILIMLSAWLIVDTLMKAALGEDGSVDGFGPWNQIDCDLASQSEPIQGTTDTFVCVGAIQGGIPTCGPLLRESSIPGYVCIADDRFETGLCGPLVDQNGDAIPEGECQSCSTYWSTDGVDLGNGVIMPFNLNPCNGLDSCFMNGVMVNRLAGMGAETEGWQISEAWPPYQYSLTNPTGIHESACHGTGTCIDVSFIDRDTAPSNAEILAFQNSAEANGLTVVYESSSATRVETLQAAGIRAAVVDVNREHFSVYMCDVDGSPTPCSAN